MLFYENCSYFFNLPLMKPALPHDKGFIDGGTISYIVHAQLLHVLVFGLVSRKHVGHTYRWKGPRQRKENDTFSLNKVIRRHGRSFQGVLSVGLDWSACFEGDAGRKVAFLFRQRPTSK
jgi:hypothetical protein